jgi:hypothetical protein
MTKKTPIYDVTLTPDQVFFAQTYQAAMTFLESQPKKSKDFKDGFMAATDAFTGAFIAYKKSKG